MKTDREWKREKKIKKWFEIIPLKWETGCRWRRPAIAPPSPRHRPSIARPRPSTTVHARHPPLALTVAQPAPSSPVIPRLWASSPVIPQAIPRTIPRAIPRANPPSASIPSRQFHFSPARLFETRSTRHSPAFLTTRSVNNQPRLTGGSPAFHPIPTGQYPSINRLQY